jgi:hypothetical protein
MASRYPGYHEFVVEIKGRSQEAQLQATLAANRELVLLYWQFGRDILRTQGEQGWGGKVHRPLSESCAHHLVAH